MEKIIAFFMPFFIILFTFFLYVVLLRKKIHSERETKIPPGSMGWPYIGETLQLYSQDPNVFFSDREKRYGEIFKTRVLGCPCIVLASPEAAKIVLVTQAHLFKPTYPKSKENLIGQSALFFHQGEYHTRLRKLVQGALYPEAIRNMVADIEALAVSATDSWAGGHVISIFREMKKFSFEVGILSIFGHLESHHKEELKKNYSILDRGYNSFPTDLPGTPYRKARKVKSWHRLSIFMFIRDPQGTPQLAKVKDSQTLAVQRSQIRIFTGLNLLGTLSVQWMESDLASLRHNLRPIPWAGVMRAPKARKKLSEILSNITRERERNKRLSEKDLLSCLLNSKDENGGTLSEDQIGDNIIGVLFAAQDTTASAMTWILKYLHDYPIIFEAVKAEQKAIYQSNRSGNSPLTWNQTRNMPFTYKVILESLRMASIISFTFREAVTDVEYKGYLIPKGWKVMPLFRNIHHSPDFFVDPLKFDPCRFEDVVKPNRFMPFGSGVHACPGNELAKLEMLVMIHHLASQLRYEVVGFQSGIEYAPFPIPLHGLPATFWKQESTNFHLSSQSKIN